MTGPMLTPEFLARVDAWLAKRKREGTTDAIAALAHEWARRPVRMAFACSDAARAAVDAAMGGVLLALVREAWRPACGSGVVILESEGPCGGGYVLVSESAFPIERFRCSGGNRFGRLVSALEAAPVAAEG